MIRGVSICLLFIIFFLYARGQSPCDIQVGINKGCSPLPVSFTFTTTNTSGIAYYNWYFGNGDSSSKPSPSYIYLKPGSYSPKVVVIFKNGTKCSVTISKPIIVYTNPNADFTVNNGHAVLLCSRGQKVCFADKSTPGTDKAPIKSWEWDFGDGSGSLLQNPCYAFADSGTYKVTLKVTDSNGCQEYIQKKITVRYTTDIGININPKFSIYIAYDCKKTVDNIIFTNLTDTAGDYLTKFIWDYGDGTNDTCDLRNLSCLSKWKSTVHTYTQTGTYIPSLYIENKFGCSNKVNIDTPIDLEPYKLMVDVFPNYPACFTSDTVFAFTVPYHSQAKFYMWDFGDPLERGTGRSPAASHTYKAPGVYNIHVTVQIGTCVYDSILCKKVKLYGPIAKIFPVKGVPNPWDSVPLNGSSLIPVSKLRSYFDTSCLSPGFKQYYTYATQKIINGEPVFDTCRADTIKKLQKDSLLNCNGKKYPNYLITYQQHIKSYKDTFEQIPTVHYWNKGDPVPSGNIYSQPPFVNRPLYMDDTALFSMRCKAPQKITFTNFSIKYRGYGAVDNNPPGYPDKCKNPVYPYASDSLTYRWDFREGAAGISTKTSPDIKARFSTEKLPTHLFQKDGCYWVILTVTDTFTNCEDQDSVPVVIQQPDAGWATQYSGIKDMTNIIQDSLPANGPRRGMIIEGRPCVNDTQFINLKETLPSCYKRQFSMVLDSAMQAIKCNNLVSWDWIHKDTIENIWTYHFYYRGNDTGWKSIGLVISNNSNCTDTVWYHNYKYMHGVYPAVNVSAQHICAGDTLKLSPMISNQPGIKTFRYFLTEIADRGDTIAKYNTDTIRYRVIKHINRKSDTITSTVHNKAWGIDDGTLNFNNMTDTYKTTVPMPGHFMIMTVINSRWGCIDTARTQITVGHYSDFNADNNILCVNDTAHFEGMAQYFIPFTRNNTGYDPRFFWRNPDSVRKGRKVPIPEQMQWDLDGDGNIDYTGRYPSFAYSKPGSYTVTLYTRDSTGCIQKLVKPGFIKVINASALFSVEYPGDTRYCTSSHFFNFIDSSYVIKPFKDSLNQFKILGWTWDFGDSSAKVKIDYPAIKKIVGHVYVSNGDYKVTLTVRTSAGNISSGCTSTFSRMVHILGPTSHFSIVGPNAGCVPFTLKVRDESKKAKLREWILGDGTIDTSKGDTFVYLTYRRPGVFYPQFYVLDTLVDLQGHHLFCADSFPLNRLIKVVVYDTNKQVLSASDTLVCSGREALYFKSVPDTGYSEWTINYGNGDTANGALPQFKYLYRKTGKYHVVISGRGAHCPDTSSVNIHVIDIKAEFKIDTAAKDTPVFNFINQSSDAVRYIWDFGDGTPKVETSSADNISHEFQKAGTLNICLTAYNQKGCADSVCHVIKIDTFLFLPNVFTPNGDAFNNHYLIPIFGNTYYDLDIFNRWGEKVFHSNNKNETWDGINHTSGMIYPEGAYYAVLKYRFIGGRIQFAQTGVTLLRK